MQLENVIFAPKRRHLRAHKCICLRCNGSACSSFSSVLHVLFLSVSQSLAPAHSVGLTQHCRGPAPRITRCLRLERCKWGEEWHHRLVCGQLQRHMAAGERKLLVTLHGDRQCIHRLLKASWEYLLYYDWYKEIVLGGSTERVSGGPLKCSLYYSTCPRMTQQQCWI